MCHPFLTEYRCKQLNCFRSFTNLNGLRKHYIISHDHSLTKTDLRNASESDNNVLRNDVTSSSLSDNPSKSNVLPNDPFVSAKSNTEMHNVKMFVSEFIGKLYNDSTLNRALVQKVCNHTRLLIDNIFTLLLDNFEKMNMQHEIKVKISEVFRQTLNNFTDLSSEHNRLKALEKQNVFINLLTPSVLI